MNLLCRWISLFVMSWIAALSTGCSGGGASADLPLQDNTGETEDGDGDQTSSTDNRFFVTLNDYSKLSAVTTDGTFEANCSIPFTSDFDDNSDISCIFDVLELDAFVQSLDLQYNVPPGMCDYVTALPSYHWNQSSGYGPSHVTLVLTDGSPTDTSDPDVCGVNEGGTPVDCDSALEAYVSDNTVQCIYDESSDDYQNCCFGSYSYTLTEIDTVESTTTTTVVPNSDWGGTIGNCLGGGSRGGWGTFSEGENIPIRLITEVDSNGLNVVLPLQGNAGSYQTRFMYQVNFAESSGNEHDHTGYSSVGSSTIPYAFEPINDLDGTLLFSTNHPYLFECWDAGRELIHRIRVYIREWNTYTEFLEYVSSSGNSSFYDPHRFGVEGTDCDYDPWDGNDSCNDYDDFQDILDAATDGTRDGSPDSYDTTTPDASVRRLWFPYVDY